jgi:hypothetical protein
VKQSQAMKQLTMIGDDETIARRTSDETIANDEVTASDEAVTSDETVCTSNEMACDDGK